MFVEMTLHGIKETVHKEATQNLRQGKRRD